MRLTLLLCIEGCHLLLDCLQDFDRSRRRADLILVMVHDEQAPVPVRFEARVFDSYRNIRAFARCKKHHGRGKGEVYRVPPGAPIERV